MSEGTNQHPLAMMMMPQQADPEPPDIDHINDDILDKYENEVKAFRERIAWMLRHHDPDKWEDESRCIHLIMHLDSRMEFALEWIEAHRRRDPPHSAPAKPVQTLDAGQYL